MEDLFSDDNLGEAFKQLWARADAKQRIAIRQHIADDTRDLKAFETVAARVIGVLNDLTGREYSASSKRSRANIVARLHEGATFEDCVAVMRFKNAQWSKDAKMAQHLNPTTLFRPKHWDNYLGEARAWVRSQRRARQPDAPPKRVEETPRVPMPEYVKEAVHLTRMDRAESIPSLPLDQLSEAAKDVYRERYKQLHDDIGLDASTANTQALRVANAFDRDHNREDCSNV